jgi:hypothetical protein
MQTFSKGDGSLDTLRVAAMRAAKQPPEFTYSLIRLGGVSSIRMTPR